MDQIDLYILFEDVLKSMRKVEIEGPSPEYDIAAITLAMAFLERVAKEVVEEHNGTLSFSPAFGQGSPQEEVWNLQLHMTIEARTKKADS
jgi:hypothetical protein